MGDVSYEKLCQRTERAQLWQTAVPGIEVFEAHLFEHQFDKHFHDAYTIGLNRAGIGQCFYRKEKHYHHPGLFNCINPGEVHTGAAIAPQGWAFQNICISKTTFQTLSQQLPNIEAGSLPFFPSLNLEDETLQILFQQLFHSLLHEKHSTLAQQSYLLLFFAQLFTHLQQPAALTKREHALSENRAVCQARDYLEAYCTETVSIETLADLTNLNPYYLIRCFKQQIGMPPHRYKKHWQLLKAKRALRTDAGLVDIATEYGFYDQSHFSRSFKQAFGLTPGQYRKSILSKKVSMRPV